MNSELASVGYHTDVPSGAYVVEVQSRAVGIIVRDGRHFVFHAAEKNFDALDRRAFTSARNAEKAVWRHAAERAGKAMQRVDAQSVFKRSAHFISALNNQAL